ncbi:MAG: glycosyltransferase family 1 protein [Halioglobus sp.]
MRVVQIMRKPNGAAFSMEHLFEDIRKELPPDVRVETYTNPYASRGLWRRVMGMVRVVWHQGDVNHVTGDIHFLNILLQRNKTILTIHDCVTLERLEGFKYQILRFFWYWLPAKRSAAVTVISESTKKELLRHLGKGSWPITVIPNFVSPDFELSQKPFNCACPVILQIGTKSNKNIERVAAALAGLRCKMIIVGKLKPSQIVALEVSKIDYENYCGISRKSLIGHYQNCDIVMLASLYEGFGLPILEGQAVGRPVITSNLYSMPDVGGDGACYVDPFNVSDIRRALNRIIDCADFREKLIASGLKNVENYRLGNVASQYAKLYEQVYLGVNA